MKHSTFKRFVCMALAFVMVLSCGITGVRAESSEVATTIRHTQTSGESNYFTYSQTPAATGLWAMLNTSSTA